MAFFVFVCIFGAFRTHLMSSWLFLPTFFDFDSILHGFERVSHWFLACRFADVLHFLRFCVNVNKAVRGRMIQGRHRKKHIENIIEIMGLGKTNPKFTQNLNL